MLDFFQLAVAYGSRESETFQPRFDKPIDAFNQRNCLNLGVPTAEPLVQQSPNRATTEERDEYLEDFNEHDVHLAQ
jgi:hypothetical protein